jgi:2-dehydro-3-deoxyphosphogluconate aldolase/(4S)-4-hydroxy-2-oxoglutarate aldolase
MGSKLVTDQAVRDGDWAGIEAHVRKTVDAIVAFRASRKA